MDKYEFEDGMAEVSGFGGTYEESCRKMIKAGLEWFDDHPKADPLFTGYRGIYGIISEDNADAKRLSDVVVAAAGDCYTGAMYQVVAVRHILHAHDVGWKTYVEAMKTR